MVSRRNTTAAQEQPQQPTEAGQAEDSPVATATPPIAVPETVNGEAREPTVKPTRRRAPSRRASSKTAKEDTPAEPASAPNGTTPTAADHSALLRAIQEMTRENRAQSEKMARELRENNDRMQSLRQAVEANNSRLQTLWKGSQETQTQLVQHTAQLNDLVQLSQAAGQDEKNVWDRLAGLGEEFRQDSDRLIERIVEQVLRLEARSDETTVRLAALHRQLEATQAALRENRANLRSVGSETQAAAEQLEVIQRECQDTAELLQATRQEIRATKIEVEATGDVAMAAALQREEPRPRILETQTAPISGAASAEPAAASETNGGRGRLGVAVDADARVVEVFPDSPAQEAGIQTGDRITAVDGRPIEKGADLPGIILRAEETAAEFTLEARRGETTHLLTIRIPAEAITP